MECSRAPFKGKKHEGVLLAFSDALEGMIFFFA
jgi:hypothetical protein